MLKVFKTLHHKLSTKLSEINLQSESYVDGIDSHRQHVGLFDVVNQVNNPGQRSNTQLRLQTFNDQRKMFTLRCRRHRCVACRLRRHKLSRQLTYVEAELCYRNVGLPVLLGISWYFPAPWKTQNKRRE